MNWYTYAANNPLSRIDPTGMFWEELKNYLNAPYYGWKTDEQLEEYKEQIRQVEEALTGFRYDPLLGGRLENQIQLYFIMQGVEESIKNEKGVDKWLKRIFEGPPEHRIEKTKRQLMNVFKYLNLRTDLYNLRHDDKKGYFYSYEEIEATIADFQALGFALFAVMYDASIMNAAVSNSPAIATSNSIKLSKSGLGKLRPQSIHTPYGLAYQSLSPEALMARKQVLQGATLYRGGTLGVSQTSEAQFWALESPLNPGYANKYGVASFVTPEFIQGGRLIKGTTFITRHAPGFGPNLGGGIEVVTPPGAVTLDFFIMP